MSWRTRFTQRIAQVMHAYPAPTARRDAALRRAYPQAPPWRGGPTYPYKVWRDEIARQAGSKPAVRSRISRGRCPLTLELFDQARCPLTLDLFE